MGSKIYFTGRHVFMLKTYFFRQCLFIFVCVTIICFFYGWLLQAKTLDIIIGGSMGEGLECKVDTDCPDNEFCHDELYVCMPCNVPPYEWTGTKCICPKNTVEKEGKNCVECLTDTDCKQADQYCHTDHNICVTCRWPKIWKDNFCVCPDGTQDIAGECVCHNPNEIIDANLKCVCPINVENCPNTSFNSQKCQCCPAERPFYDSALMRCIECRTHADCTEFEPVCNKQGECEACPEHEYFNGKECTKCPYAGEEYIADEEKCVIKLSTVSYSRDYGSKVGRRWMVNYGFGPYKTNYEVWVEGYADDVLYFDVNKTLSYCNWSSDTSCKTTNTNDPWSIGDLFEFSGGYIANTVHNPNGRAKMGTLKAGDRGAVHVGSDTGWLEWRKTNNGKGPRIWLERSVKNEMKKDLLN